MAPTVVHLTLPLSEGGIIFFTMNFLPYQAYLRSNSTSSLTTTCPQISNVFISNYKLKFILHDHDSDEIKIHLNVFYHNVHRDFLKA